MAGMSVRHNGPQARQQRVLCVLEGGFWTPFLEQGGALYCSGRGYLTLGEARAWAARSGAQLERAEVAS